MNVVEAVAVSNVIVLINEAAGTTNHRATNAEVNEDLAEQVEVEQKELKYDKVIKEVLISKVKQPF